ncbi:CdaR family transcriptional regulator [Caproicibacter fermentans]|uniref:Helix-turn-helix domain-containing protein n=1 Tax=Caproicibacter fermentans TaxID=2576756 RepID=A0A7G8T8Y5_9FIRM|nr:sugar diacid recognition domain-containing protein [Caproicibacter fermentans]QNK40076.1 helix-turn-helix domain-containing protein [Caproicibacter fermentans]
MRFEEMAQELVEATSRLVGGRIINIMNTKGVIISSTERDRIGTIHAGACEVIRSGRAVAIEKNAINQYPGAREGYNMPVYSGGNLIAVVGIFGNPDEVRETANLLAVYTAKCIELNAVALQQQVTSEMRTRYLHLLLALSPSDDEMLASLGSALCIQQKFPIRVILIRINTGQDALHEQQKMNRLAESLLYHQLINSQCDVWGTVNNRLVIVKSGMTKSEDKYTARMNQCLEDCMKEAFHLCIGGLCFNSKDIKRSYEETSALCFCTKEPTVSDITKTDCKFRYLMQNTYAREKHDIDEMYEILKTKFSDGELNSLMETAACYYQKKCSVNLAADELHIHKNTLQYRLHKLWDALDLNDSDPFIKEYFMRLCFMRHEG